MHNVAPTGAQDPDLRKCRTAPVGSVIPGTAREMFYCRIDNDSCRFAMPFGFDYICRHLDSHQFLSVLDEELGDVTAKLLADSTGVSAR